MLAALLSPNSSMIKYNLTCKITAMSIRSWQHHLKSIIYHEFKLRENSVASLQGFIAPNMISETEKAGKCVAGEVGVSYKLAPTPTPSTFPGDPSRGENEILVF